MALVPLAEKGHFMHVYDFRVKPGMGEQFIRLFNDFDYSDENPMHKSSAQVKDGVLCRDVGDPDHQYARRHSFLVRFDCDLHRDVTRPQFKRDTGRCDDHTHFQPAFSLRPTDRSEAAELALHAPATVNRPL